jgi:hypothetical protein
MQVVFTLSHKMSVAQSIEGCGGDFGLAADGAIAHDKAETAAKATAKQAKAAKKTATEASIQAIPVAVSTPADQAIITQDEAAQPGSFEAGLANEAQVVQVSTNMELGDEDAALNQFFGAVS